MRMKRHSCLRLRSCVMPSLALAVAILVTACATPNQELYRWGDYEEIIYAGYKNPGSSDAVADAQRLAADMERTESEGRNVPPGVRVHLSYLYFNQGREDEAKVLLEEEKAVFPASSVFVDRLLSSMGPR